MSLRPEIVNFASIVAANGNGSAVLNRDKPQADSDKEGGVMDSSFKIVQSQKLPEGFDGKNYGQFPFQVLDVSAKPLVNSNGVLRENKPPDYAGHIPYIRRLSEAGTALGYLPLSNGLLSIDQVHQELLGDEYNGRCRSLVLLQKGSSLAEHRFAGAIRLVQGSDHPQNHTNMLELLDLLDVDISKLPHMRDGVSTDFTAELSRFTIHDNYRKKPLKEEVVRVLFDAMMLEARAMGVQYLYAIMPEFVTNVLGDRPIELIGGVRLLTELDESELTDAQKVVIAQLYDRYPLYWRHANPKLYQLLMQ
jgi:hypothetical protein